MFVQKCGPNPLGANYISKFTYADVAAQGADTDAFTVSAFPGTTRLTVAPYTAEFPTVGTSGTDTAPAGTKVECVGMKLVTPFNETAPGTDVTALTVQLGLAAGNTLLAETQIAEDSTEILYAPGSGVAQTMVAADTVDVVFTPTTVNNSLYTKGEVWFFLKVDDLGQFNDQV